MTRKILVEGIGTFFLVMTVGMVVLEPGAGPFAPLGVGGVLMAMVYAGGPISGAHYNPAVTVAVFLRGKATIHELIGYVIFQVVAASVAAVLVLWIKEGGPLTIPELDLPPVLVVEFVFTFALCYVVLNVATSKNVEGNSYYGLAIGIIVMGGAYSVGSVSGALFNPAVTVGSYVLGGISGIDALFYSLTQVASGITAATLFKVLDLGDERGDDEGEDAEAAAA